MKSYIWVTFGFLALAFYQLSGGAAFEPETRVTNPTRVAFGPSVAKRSSDVAPVATRTVTDTLTVAPVIVTATDSIQASVIAASLTDAPAAAPKSAAEALALLASQDSTSKLDGSLVSPSADIRTVAGSRVNMRQGPSTRYGVVTTLTQGTEAEVLETTNGWARIRVVETGKMGWMAESLLREANG
ncbi:SH3 domain-containing protein [Marivivens sp. LCG002]|uniref:SH3 domain-containing protein n=1 Tax=Marivivens sp. LCG002 TaxID=3051171 RepID=UPI002556BD52|nr:SH3 domain-containing protein [Marivivens sp. LCG002]WIV51063.1 SH3 domain-containing protein [Marivivens sp. LCG002]